MIIDLFLPNIQFLKTFYTAFFKELTFLHESVMRITVPL